MLSHWASEEDVMSIIHDPETMAEISDLTITGDVMVPMFPPNLKKLTWSDSSLTSLPPLPESLETLILSKMAITMLEEIPPHLRTLSCIDVPLIWIAEFPPQMSYLRLNRTQLTHLPEFPASVANLDLRENRLTRLPETIVHCPLEYLAMTGNPIQFTPDQLMKLYRWMGDNFYQNSENVEQRSAIESWYRCVVNLMNDPVDETMKEIEKEIEARWQYDDERRLLLTPWMQEQICTYAPKLKGSTEWKKFRIRDRNFSYVDRTEGSTLASPPVLPEVDSEDEVEDMPDLGLGRLTDPTSAPQAVNKTVSFKQLWIRVWTRILKSEHREELCHRLFEEIISASPYCDNGYRQRLVNCLTGFYDDISIGPSKSQEMAEIVRAAMKQTKNEGYTEGSPEFREAWKKTLLTKFLEKGVDEEQMQEWVSPLLGM